MKFNKLFLLILSVLSLALSSRAQTPASPTIAAPSLYGGLAEILQSVGLVTDPTNYAGAVFYGRSLKGNQSSAGVLVIENVNNYVGIAAGVDTLWGGGKTGSANIVAGGLSLKSPTTPLAFFAQNSFTTNFVMTPFALLLAGTPVNGTGGADGGLASIVRTGVNFDIYKFKSWQLGAGIDYGTRNGSGNYNGNWIDLSLSVRYGF